MVPGLKSTYLVSQPDKITLIFMIFSGDNFGVQIQEEVLNEIHRSQESAYNLRDAARQHSLQRAKICSKVVKYPHVEDWTVCYSPFY